MKASDIEKLGFKQITGKGFCGQYENKLIGKDKNGKRIIVYRVCMNINKNNEDFKYLFSLINFGMVSKKDIINFIYFNTFDELVFILKRTPLPFTLSFPKV